MKFILGKKLNMSQIFLEDGTLVPVTIVNAGPCQITQVKDGSKDNAKAVQIGFGEIKDFRLATPQKGHLKDLNLAKHLRDFIVEDVSDATRGDVITVDTFVVGDKVQVEGISKGKGFQGVVKRHHFHGGPASHGHKDNLRAPGSIGAGGVQRVFKGMRMAGRMGGARITVKNLEVIKVVSDKNQLYLKGAVPGGRNSMIMISGPGVLKTVKNNKVAEDVKVEATA